MLLCSDGHEEVCYDGKQCPVCEAIQEKKDIEDDNLKLRLRIEELENGMD